MLTHVARRLLVSIPVLWVVLTAVFFAFRVVPGDAAEQVIASRISQEQYRGTAAQQQDLRRLRHQFGLDQPLLSQYGIFLRDAAHLDFGNSLADHRPVFADIGDSLPYTAELVAAALFLATLFGLSAGILAAVYNRRTLGSAITGTVVLGFSIPSFWLGPMLAVLFGVKLHWLPVAGPGDLRHLILPAVTVAVAPCAVLTRYTRASLVEALHQDFIRTARAKGLGERTVVLKHALRNALIPVVTVLGLMAAGLMTGVIIVENIFAWPGIGNLTLQAVNSRNYPLIEGITLFVALFFIGANLLVDTAYALLDPRITYA